MHLKSTLNVLLGGMLLAFAATSACADPERLPNDTRYDQEYPVIGYSGPATHNRIYRLQQQLASGQVKLAWEPKFGLLRSLLKALDIDPDSQILVYSRTSLQIEHINGHTPRAIYFNDDTYIGYVQDTPLIEVATIDSEKGAVFYAFDNERESLPAPLTREGSRCLSCHDTYSMMGGGVPRVMVMSAPVDDPSDARTHDSADETADATPIAERWGGWFVTGHTGTQTHFGNLPLRQDRGGEKLRELEKTRLNLMSVKGYIDTANWPTDKSDVVALLVAEHQTIAQDVITRVNYKIRTVMSRADNPEAMNAPRTWADINPADQKRVQLMIEPLVKALFFQDAAAYPEPIRGSSGFAERFAKQGPFDSKGRSLRELDLDTRLLRYPLSYTIYSPQFDALPQYVLDYVYGRIVEILQGRDTSGIAARIAPEDRQAISEILIDTKPALAKLLRGAEVASR